jgi:uncharacterized membrane protein
VEQAPVDSPFEHGSLEFARVANLSDAVFAIAMTLLVLTLDVPRPGAGGLAGTLVGQLPQLVAFALAFALVANLWWQHHKLVALFAVVEPGLVGVNLVLLGAVALVPFPTSLVGNEPTERAAVLAFIAVFTVLSLLFLVLVARAQRTGAWRAGVTDQQVHRLLGQWGAGIVVLLLAALVAVWQPVVGLVVIALTMVLGPVAARRGTVAARLERRFQE